MIKKHKPETKLVVLSIRDYILKKPKGAKKAEKEVRVAMIDADITVRVDKKLERFAVQLPLDQNIEFKTCILEIVAEAIKLKFPDVA